MSTRVALVHEWLVKWGGSESVLRSLADLFPDAPIYTSVWAPDGQTQAAFGHRDVRTTFLQHAPGRGRIYRHLLHLMPAAFRRLDLSEYDLVISSSHAFAKGVRTRPDATHVCYCHTPPRYLWDMAHEYRNGLGAVAFRGRSLRWLRERDREAAAGVDRFVANSEYVRDRIARAYDRPAAVVHPPVDLPEPAPSSGRSRYFVAGGRLVPYKRVDLAVEAANRVGAPLRVFGDGPERARLEKLAGPTVRFVGRPPDHELVELLASARAYVFPGEEDFGILPVEAQAAGTPVIALDAGGARETVERGRTGAFFAAPTVEALAEAMLRFDPARFDAATCRANAERFSRARFEERMRLALAARDRTRTSPRAPAPAPAPARPSRHSSRFPASR